MRRIMAGLVLLLVSMQVVPVHGQSAKYPPLSEYMMTPEGEMALARSAAPENVSAHATVKILTASGFKVAAQGDNGFVCIVMRGWGPDVYTRTVPGPRVLLKAPRGPSNGNCERLPTALSFVGSSE